MNLVCLECDEGPLKWDDPEVKSLDDPMTCQNCGFIYLGMGAYIKERDDRGDYNDRTQIADMKFKDRRENGTL